MTNPFDMQINGEINKRIRVDMQKLLAGKLDKWINEWKLMEVDCWKDLLFGVNDKIGN